MQLNLYITTTLSWNCHEYENLLYIAQYEYETNNKWRKIAYKLNFHAILCIKVYQKAWNETDTRNAIFYFFHSAKKKKNHNKEELKEMQRQFRKGNQEQVVNLHEIVYKTFGGNIYYMNAFIFLL